MAASPSLVVSAPSPRQAWDSAIPPMLRPMVRAYGLGYLSAVGPRLVTLLIQHVVRRRLTNNKKKQATTARDAQHGDGESFQAALKRILRGGLDWRRFPTFCAVLVGVTTLLEVCLMPPNIARLFRISCSVFRATTPIPAPPVTHELDLLLA